MTATTTRASGLAGLWNLVIGLGLVAVVAGVVLHGGSDPAPAYPHLRPADPVRLRVASLGLDAPVVPIEVGADRVLDPPRDTADVGWWDGSARPGRGAGQTVITGHTVHTGGGAMDRLPEIRRGAAVDVTTASETTRYRVQRVALLSHERLAAESEGLFGQDGDARGRLVLVSCTDWNGSFYRRNVVVLATPVSVTAARPG